MSYSLRENLEIVHLNDTDSIHRSQCGFRYCRADQNWREFCKLRLLSPANAGSLMSILNGQYLMRQLYCPSPAPCS
jgi:hypothetical protein